MEPAKRKRLFFGIIVASMLALIVVGVALTFAQNLDARHIFVDISLYWCTLPFALGFPVYIALEYFLSGKYHEEAYLLKCRSNSHAKVINATFFVTALCLIAGATLTFSLANAIPIGWICFIESLISALPMLFYLGFTLIQFGKDDAPAAHYIQIGAFIGTILIVEMSALLLTLRFNLGFLLLYAVLPLLGVVMSALSPDEAPSNELETLE